MLKFGSRSVAIFTALIAAAGASVVAPAVLAEPASLEGSWSGGGRVNFSTGNSENARCRASFRKRGGNSFSMSAVCATTSARVEQTAQLVRTGANRYAGDFQNAEYGVSGSISITVNGNSMNASLNGGGASANLRLSR